MSEPKKLGNAKAAGSVQPDDDSHGRAREGEHFAQKQGRPADPGMLIFHPMDT